MDPFIEPSKSIVDPISEIKLPMKIEADHDAFENFMNSFQENSLKLKDSKKDGENYYNLDIGTEHLIQVMERHPGLWDPRHIDYPNKQKRDTEWIKVADELLPNWNFINETQDVLREIKKRWRNTRDSYKKDKVNRSQCGDPIKRKRRRYIFSKQLSFLDPVLEFKEFNRATNATALSNVSAHLEEGPLFKLENLEPYTSPVRQPNSTTSQHHPNNFSDRKLQDFGHFLNARKKYPSNNSSNNSNATANPGQKFIRAEDEDRYFLLSLLKDIKKVPDNRKLQLKTELLMLIQKYQVFDSDNLSGASTGDYLNGFDYEHKLSKSYSSSNSSSSESAFGAGSNDEQ